MTFRTRFDPDTVGSFVMHCHILTHEDIGMMQRLTILPADTWVPDNLEHLEHLEHTTEETGGERLSVDVQGRQGVSLPLPMDVFVPRPVAPPQYPER